MVGVAPHGHLRPGDADDALDDADRDTGVLQHGTLLDVQLQIGGDGAGAIAALALVADALQLVTEALAVAVGAAVDVVGGEAAGNGAGGEHGRLKANALFVRPVDQLQRLAGGHARVVQRAHHLQRRHHPIRAVVAAAAADGVDVGGHHHGGAALCAAPPTGHVAEVVDAHAQPGLLHPAAEQVARGTVLIRKRQPGHAPAGGGPNLGQLAQALVQAVGVDADGRREAGGGRREGRWSESSLIAVHDVLLPPSAFRLPPSAFRLENYAITRSSRVASFRRRPPAAVQTTVSSMRMPNWPGK